MDSGRSEEEAAMRRYAIELYKFCKKKDHTDCAECIFRVDDWDCAECIFRVDDWYCNINVPEDWKVSKREV